MALKSKLGPLAENMGEAGAACLLAMVQGNVLVLGASHWQEAHADLVGASHWLIATRTGILAGLVATAAILLSRTERRWIVAVVLGVVTGVVDYLVHPGGFGAQWTEAAVTGVGAALLSYFVGSVLARRKRAVSAGSE